MTTRNSLLIIEDEIELLSYYYELTSDYFNDISVANTISEAVHIIDDKTIDCIIMDNHLPDGTGIELLTRLNAKGCTYPTMVITANPDKKNAVNAANCFVYKFLAKPLCGQYLSNILKDFSLFVQIHKNDLRRRSYHELSKPSYSKLVDSFHLTNREIEVIQQSLIKGNNNKKLAKELFVSVATIKKHWQNIFDKTNLRSRKELNEYIATENLTSYRSLSAS